MATLRNTQTGAVGEYPDHVVDNPVLFSPDVFVKVEDGAKPYAPELYKGRSAEEFTAQHSDPEVDETEEVESEDDWADDPEEEEA